MPNKSSRCYVDREGKRRPMTQDGDILGCRACDMQVDLLEPGRCRMALAVGTVDKFQVQEAEVVIVCMATSGAAGVCAAVHQGCSTVRTASTWHVARPLPVALLVASPELMAEG